MKRLYKQNPRGSVKFKGLKLDTVNVKDEDLKHYTANGWGCAWEILESTANPKEDKDVVTTFEEVDTNKSGKLSAEEVREAAKEAGIDGWDKKRIKTLTKELGLGDGDK